MAQLSVSISTEYGSSFDISTSVQGLLNIVARTYILSGYNNPDGSPRVHLYSNDVLNIHGTPADLRLFAERLIDATEEPAAEPACECTTINEDTVDATSCAVHGSRGALDKAIRENHARNAAVAEPLRSVVNAIGGEKCPF